MKLIEKILIPVYLVSILIMILMRAYDLEPIEVRRVAGLVSIASMLALCIYYSTKFKPRIFSLAFGLLAMSPVHQYFAYQHYPGGSLIFLIHSLAFILIGAILIKLGLFDSNGNKWGIGLRVGLGIMLIYQWIFTYLKIGNGGWAEEIVTYGDHILLALVLISNNKVYTPELRQRKILIILTLQLSYYVLNAASKNLLVLQ